jgi:hypothetical protein
MRVSLTCPAGTAGCDVTLRLKQGTRSVGEARRVVLAAGRSAKPTLRFDARLLRTLRTAGGARVRLTVASRGGSTRTKAVRVTRRSR